MNGAVTLFDWLRYYLSYLQFIFTGYPLVVRISVFIVTCILVLSILLALFVTFFYIHKVRGNRVKYHIRKKYSDNVHEIITSDVKYGSKEIVDKLNLGNKKLSYLEKRWFTSLIGYMRIELGEKCNMDNLHTVVDVCNLHDFFERELQYSDIKHRVRMLRFLTILEEEVPGSKIIPLQFTRFESVRKSAQYAYMLTDNSNAFTYFSSPFFQSDFCLLDKVDINYVLKRRQKSGRSLPDLGYWANQVENQDAKSVFVAEARHLNEPKYCKDFSHIFLTSTEDRLKSQIVVTWNVLNYNDGKFILFDLYSKQSEFVKAYILKSISRSESVNSLEFIENAVENAGSLKVKFAGAEALYNYSEEGKAFFYKIKESAPEQEKVMYEEIEHGLVRNNEWEDLL